MGGTPCRRPNLFFVLYDGDGDTPSLPNLFLFPRQRDLSRARQFQHAEGFHQVEEFFHLAVVASDLDRQRFGLHVHDFGAENIRDLHHLGARLGIHANLHEHEFAVHIFFVAKVLHLDHVRQFVELLDDLVERGVIARGDDGHARKFRVVRRADVERINVIAAAAEQSGHAREHAELVLNQN
jgi:hypothetical protein